MFCDVSFVANVVVCKNVVKRCLVNVEPDKTLVLIHAMLQFWKKNKKSISTLREIIIMTLCSPEPITHQNMMAIVSKGMNIEVYDPALELNIPKNIVVTYFNEFRKNRDGTTTVEIPSSQIARAVTANEIKNFYLFQTLIGNCVSNAEAINRRLFSLLNNIQTKERKNEDLSGLEFMKLRDRLSNILKAEKKLK